METIKSGIEISRLFSAGRRITTPYLTFIVSDSASQAGNTKRHGHQGRVAFIAGKKLGNAVWRNKAKRRMRALCQDLKGPWPDKDVIFLAKSSLLNNRYSKVLHGCQRVVAQFRYGKEESL